MPRLVKRRWEPSFHAEGFRGASESFTYEAYVPDKVADLDVPVGLALAGEIETAMAVLTDLQGLANMAGLEAMSRHLLRAESIGSSRIEGLRISQRRLARALVDPTAEGEVARAVIGNIAAMEEAIRLGVRSAPFGLSEVVAIHEHLFVNTSQAALAGKVRQTQNWIGGSDWSPRGAEFIPPPESDVPALLEDLCAFIERRDLPGILQAAIVHAQFETIHPFSDGSGRVGRTLIHVVLRRRGLAPHVEPPVSLVLAANPGSYVEGLTMYREGDVEDWCRRFARTLAAAATHARALAMRLSAMQDSWREAAGRPRIHSAAEKLIGALPARPVLDLRTAAELTGGSLEGARKGLATLEAAGILRPLILGRKRNRVWEARELLQMLDALEWDLATPTRRG